MSDIPGKPGEPSAAEVRATALIARMSDGDLSPQEGAELRAMFKASPALLQDYVEQAVAHATLEWRYAQVADEFAEARYDTAAPEKKNFQPHGEIAPRRPFGEPGGKPSLPLRSDAEFSTVVAQAPNSRRSRPTPVLGFLRRWPHIGRGSPAMVSGAVLAVGVIVAAILLLGRAGLDRPPQPAGPPPMAAADNPSAKRVTRDAGPPPVKRDAETPAATSAQVASHPSAAKPSAARLVGAVACRWANGSAAPRTGDPLPEHCLLGLQAGAVEILFSGGATGLVLAPALLEIRSGNAVRINQGVFSVDNPTPRSFEVFAPGVKYVSISTELGLNVSAAGVQEVHVFRGRVNAANSVDVAQALDLPLPAAQRGRTGQEAPFGGSQPPISLAQPIELLANEACRIQGDNLPVEHFEADGMSFIRVADFASLSPRFLQWKDSSLQRRNDPDLIAYFNFQGEMKRPDVLRNRAASGEKLDGQILGASWIEGRWPSKGALQFHAPDNCVRVNIPGNFDVLTAAAWVKVHSLRQPYASLLDSDGWHTQIGQCHWRILGDGRVQLVPCLSLAPGSVEPVKLTASSKPVFDIDDRDAWRHLAVVYDSHANTVTYFKNGRSFGAVHPSVPLPPLVFGPSKIGNWEPDAAHADKRENRYFHGYMDELMLLRRALSEGEIKTLYETGKE
jgi:hypothetical protein